MSSPGAGTLPNRPEMTGGQVVSPGRRSGGALARVHETVVAWQDPVARHRRSVRRARAALGRRIVAATGLGAAAAVLLPYSGIGLPDVGWTTAAAAAAASALVAGRRVRRLERHVPPPALPRQTSAARPATDRLGRAVGALTALTARLGAGASDPAVEAAAAERSLRELAARVDAVEAALAIAPAEAYAGLIEARRLILARLHEGIEAYERLVGAVAQCVAADAIGPSDAVARHRLDEATDALHGLAAGLSEVHRISRIAG